MTAGFRAGVFNLSTRANGRMGTWPGDRHKDVYGQGFTGSTRRGHRDLEPTRPDTLKKVAPRVWAARVKTDLFADANDESGQSVAFCR